MPISFKRIIIGKKYSRNALAEIWGYNSYHPLARGVVTPKKDNKIILFVTIEKQGCTEQYHDKLDGYKLYWEGPNDHFAEKRMIEAANTTDEIHLFYRPIHHSDFTYCGQVIVKDFQAYINQPSKFTFELSAQEL